MDQTLLKIKKYYLETEAARKHIQHLQADDDLSDHEKARQERLLMRGLEQRRQATMAEVSGIFSERIQQAKQAQELSSDSIQAANAVIQAITALGSTATAREIGNITASLKGNNAALSMVHNVLKMNGQVKPEQLAGVAWGPDVTLEAQRHEAMRQIVMNDGLHPSLSTNLEANNPSRMQFNVGLKLFGEPLGYMQAGEVF